jgi:hypothetical protein
MGLSSGMLYTGIFLWDEFCGDIFRVVLFGVQFTQPYFPGIVLWALLDGTVFRVDLYGNTSLG